VAQGVQTPLIGSEGTVYVIDEKADAVYALNAETGGIGWTYRPRLGEKTGFVASRNWYAGFLSSRGGPPAFSVIPPLLAKDGTLLVLVAAKSDDTSRPFATTLQALDSNGRLKWQFEMPTKPQASGREVPSELAYGPDGTIVVGYTGLLHNLTSDGKLKWTTSLAVKDVDKTSRAVQNVEEVTRISTAEDGSIYLGFDQWVFKVAKDGTLQWEREVPGYSSGPLAVGKDGSVYLGASDLVLYAIGPDGTTRFKTDKHPSGASTVAMALGTDGTIYLYGDNDRALLLAIDEQGSTRWTLSGAARTWLQNLVLDGTGTIFVADAPLYSDVGRLRTVGSDRTIRWELKFVDEHYGIVSVALGGNGLLYVDTDGAVVCLAGP
jgi:outer membrane protein assembly factor BamB